MLQPIPTSPVAAGFLDLLGSTESELGFAAGLLRRESPPDAVRRLLFQIKTHFVVEIAFGLPAAE
jgi:hypothetical protein